MFSTSVPPFTAPAQGRAGLRENQSPVPCLGGDSARKPDLRIAPHAGQACSVNSSLLAGEAPGCPLLPTLGAAGGAVGTWAGPQVGWAPTLSHWSPPTRSLARLGQLVG